MDGERTDQRRPLAARVCFMLGLVLQLLLLLLSPYVSFISGIRSDACWNDCSYAVIDVGIAVTLGAPLIVLVAVVAITALRRRQRRPIWLPYAGIATTCVLWLLAYGITGAGLPGGALAH